MDSGILPPETNVVLDDNYYRAELVVYVTRAGGVKDLRLKGPMRSTRREALKDCIELRSAAVKGGPDPSLFLVRERRRELEDTTWTEKDMSPRDLENAEGSARPTTSFRREVPKAQSIPAPLVLGRPTLIESAEVIIDDGCSRPAPVQRREQLKPVGKNWTKPGQLCQLPKVSGPSGDCWLIHERQESTGKYKAWLFFNTVTGKYYQERGTPGKLRFFETGVPNSSDEYTLTLRVGNACLPSSAGKKLDMAVSLPELHKTGFLLKQPLEFLDRPAALFMLYDGLRNSSAATEFCAKRFHTLVLSRLSARATEWEDFELADVLRESVEAMDNLLLDNAPRLAGSGIAVGLLVGSRLVVGSLGGSRCILCTADGSSGSDRGTASASSRAAALAAASKPWTAQLLTGSHTIANEGERLRVESVGNRLLDTVDNLASEIRGRSMSKLALDAVPDEREREMLRVTRAANPFAALGVSPEDLKEGSASVRKIFRQRSLKVHPDKVPEAERPRAVAVFAKLDAASIAIEAMLQADADAAVHLAEIFAAHDESCLLADPAKAAKLLGVTEGTTKEGAKQASKRKFYAKLSRLQDVCNKEVAQAYKILTTAEDTIVRGSVLWTPPDCDAGVGVTRALGCADLKSPAQILTAGLATEVVELKPGFVYGLALLAHDLHSVEEVTVAARLKQHRSRPRAAALGLCLGRAASEAGAGAVCAYFEVPSSAQLFGAPPEPKRPKVAGRPDRVRISHVLLTWALLKGVDEMARPGVLAPTRTQVEAETMLLELLEELSKGEPKTLGTRFKAAVLKHSECASALSVPYADLGWLEPGGAEPALEAVAFNTPEGCLSDIVVTTRGAHLLYRMA